MLCINRLKTIFLTSCTLAFFNASFSADIFDFEKRLFQKTQKSSATQSSAPAANPAPSAGIAFVDMGTVLLFHPEMKTYNFKVHNFYRPIPKQISVPLDFYLSQRQKESLEMIQKYRTEHDNLKQKIQRLERVSQQELTEFDSKKRQILADGNGDTIARVQALQEQYNLRSQKLFEQISNARSSLSEIWEKTYGNQFLRLEERSAKLKSIMKNVYDTLDLIRAKSGYAVILNNHFNLPPKSPELSPLMFFTNSYSGTNQLSDFLQSGSLKFRGDFKPGPDYYKQMLEPYWTHASEINGIFNFHEAGAFVLSGGKDITSEVLSSIYEQYNQADNAAHLIPVLNKFREESRYDQVFHSSDSH
jgi:hypothetical protein